jgi:dienelactone hydrolase
MHRLERVAGALCGEVTAAVVQPASGHGPGSGRTAPPGEWYQEEVSASDVHRTAQVDELDSYVMAIKNDGSEDRLAELFTPDYSSAADYEMSCEGLRAAFAKTIGYPPPAMLSVEESADGARFERIGDDYLATYYRCWIPITAQVQAYGLYIIPKADDGGQLPGPLPLMLSVHGGGGSPEGALFGPGNYHGMVRQAAAQKYMVWAPQHLFNAQGYPPDIRNQMDQRLKLVGTSLTAIEIMKITRPIDVLIKGANTHAGHTSIDPDRIGLVGLSYGGYYALVAPALDLRIKVTVCSCYAFVQELRYRESELSVPLDFHFMDRFTLFREPEVCALICPRYLQIQAGKTDMYTHRDPALAPATAAYWESLQQGSADASGGAVGEFEYVRFEGGHEFDDDSAWSFVSKHL